MKKLVICILIMLLLLVSCNDNREDDVETEERFQETETIQTFEIENTENSKETFSSSYVPNIKGTYISLPNQKGGIIGTTYLGNVIQVEKTSVSEYIILYYPINASIVFQDDNIATGFFVDDILPKPRAITIPWRFKKNDTDFWLCDNGNYFKINKKNNGLFSINYYVQNNEIIYDDAFFYENNLISFDEAINSINASWSEENTFFSKQSNGIVYKIDYNVKKSTLNVDMGKNGNYEQIYYKISESK